MDKGRIIFEGDVDEAIEIYMSAAHNEWSEGQTEFNLEECKSRSPYTEGNVRINYLKLMGKDLAMYRSDEHVKMKIRVASKRAFEDLRLRIELRYSDDTPVGTMPNVSLGSIGAGEEKEYLVDFAPAGLSNGKFRVDLVLFETDDVGNSYDQELLLPAFFFEVQQAEDIVWNQTTWGHVRFPDAEITPLT